MAPVADTTQAAALPRVLFVDDEQRVLDAITRNLGDAFAIETATSGAMGLELIKAKGPFAVVVSDMRMPVMDGATFLRHAMAAAPDTTRMLLTGQTDFASTIAAVNEGHIFRFLCKPCPTAVLEGALLAGIKQHQLILAERELLDKTLIGSVNLLMDVLAVAAPGIFVRSNAMRNLVRHATARLRLEDAWIYELAALLSHIGCVALPSDVLDRIQSGQDVSATDRKLYAEHPEAGFRMLTPVPRLERVAAIVRAQNQATAPLDMTSSVAVGGALLRLAAAVDDHLRTGVAATEALARERGRHDARLWEALGDYAPSQEAVVVKALRVDQLTPNMILDEDVRATNGAVVIPSKRELTAPLIERLRRFAEGVGITEPIRVRIPAGLRPRS